MFIICIWFCHPGPMYFNEVYHLFYQYNPYAPVWGNITWAHSVSYNLVDWVHLEAAINPTDPFDILGCWSGSTTILPGGKPVIVYTGADSKNNQIQNLAIPKNRSDPFLTEWVKSTNNPVMTPGSDIGPQDFRDPTTAWQGPDQVWRLVVGSKINGQGTALLYKSKDFVNWSRTTNPLHSSNKTGMWECPDFYPVKIYGINGLDTSVEGNDTKHVLKASFNDHDHYIIGNYDAEKDSYVVETDFMDDRVQLRFDYGKFYASKSFYDSAKKRRIVWAWVVETTNQTVDIEKEWSGLQSIPRTILLDKSGKQLIQWPVKEIEKLRGEKAEIREKEMSPGIVLEVVGVTASQADVEVSFSVSNLEDAEVNEPGIIDPQRLCIQKTASDRGVLGPFGLVVLASSDFTEQTSIFFRIFKNQENYSVLMCSDHSRSSKSSEFNKTNFGAFVDIDPSKKISLRTLIDHSIVESFGGEGRTCITSRVYPTIAINDAAHLYVFNNGTKSISISSLEAWSMKRAQIMPLRKRRKHPTNN
ncbi:hypothetical protein Leryth_023523 [Lithospermum erythrorhizon]|nr:hypothetical protein Leryth_023523 [Lithospermum erythrorhizon]